MSLFYGAAALFVLATVLGGLVRVARGPTDCDRMMTASLFGTGGVAVLLLLGAAGDLPALQDVALVFALLASIASAVFVSRELP